MERSDAALYARTSTSIQQSCGTQLQLARKLADERGWRTAFRLKDEAWRGHAFERPGYKRLLELVEEERIQVAVVWKLDRLFRSLKEASAAQEMFTAHKVAIVSCTEPFDTTTSVGRFVYGFLANVAAFETDLIRERSELGYERRVREGKWTGPWAPFGYAKDDSGKLAIVPAEAEVLRAMHRMYARLQGDGQLAAWLNQAGQSCRGRPFTADRVRRALTNPVSCGDLTQRRAHAEHPDLAIVSRRRFRQTMERRRQLRYLGVHQGRAAREEGLDRVLNCYLQGLAEDPEGQPTP